jgi:hypothetical protein
VEVETSLERVTRAYGADFNLENQINLYTRLRAMLAQARERMVVEQRGLPLKFYLELKLEFLKSPNQQKLQNRRPSS